MGVFFPSGAIAAAPASGENGARPNLLITLVDDMGCNDVSFHGGPIPTPNIGRLAREGVQLNCFYTNPKCTPTRAALLTGRDPLKPGLTYATVYPWNAFGIAPSDHFSGDSFRAQGDEPAIIGKWHLGHTVPRAEAVTMRSCAASNSIRTREVSELCRSFGTRAC